MRDYSLKACPYRPLCRMPGIYLLSASYFNPFHIEKQKLLSRSLKASG